MIEVTPIQTPPAAAERYRSEGHWRDETVPGFLSAILGGRPDGTINLLLPGGDVERMTFLDLLGAAGEVAAALTSADAVDPGTPLAVFGGNDIETLTLLVGALLAGATVLPLPGYLGLPGATLEAERFGARMVVAEDLSLRGATQVGAAAGGRRQSRVDPAAAAMIGRTAGTEGAATGAVHSHRSLLAEVRQLGQAIPPGGYPLLIASPLAHAIGFLGGFLVPAATGQDVHLMSIWNPERAIQYTSEFGISCASGLPALCERLLASPSCDDDIRRSFGIVGLGGDASPESLVRDLDASGSYVHRMYGCTEHPSVSGSAGLDRSLRLHTEGRPLPGVEIRFADENGDPLPGATEGYIQTRGPDLCSGLLHADGVRKAVAAEGWLHTGDVGRLEDGCLRAVARGGDTVKRSGTLVNLAEVEAALAPLLSQPFGLAAVPGRVGFTDSEIVLFVEGDTPPSLMEIRGRIAERLPRNHMPSRVVSVARIPTTQLGKVNRRALQELAAAR